MSRENSPFQYGGQWLDRVAKSPHWYRFWYEPKLRRTCKGSLKTTNLERAKEELVRIASLSSSEPRSPEVVQMLVVEAAYLQHHLAGRARTTIEAKRAFRTINDFLSRRSRNHRAFRVAEFDLIEQRAYMRELASRGLSTKSISTALSYAAAAIKWAARDQVVEGAKRDRQVRILSHATKVETSVSKVADVIGSKVDHGPRWIPQPAQLATFIDAISPSLLAQAGIGAPAGEMLFRFVVIALNTWGRREAVTDLTMDSVDFDLGLVNLNPAGRDQTRKRRPVIRLTDNLRNWLSLWGEEQPIQWYRSDRSDIWDGFRSIAHAVQMPRLTPHVLRHFMNSRALALGVPGEERSMWLGHLYPSKSPTTEIYEHAQPDFLERSKQATDQILAEVDALMRVRRLVADDKALGSRNVE